ncbi:unnamed protein product [Arctia plantaginis]|uniref:Peptidase S1 domain-containing protein n=1 Tax=Arctia plantaginis TaxID=874455 RepID=A0A8S1B6I9_ARCPL|nr:unnamed protein product [Arctia plantaginis]
MWRTFLLFVVVSGVCAKINEDDPKDIGSFDDDLDESLEHIGAMVTQVYQHPYSVSLLLNNSYICSAIILNSYWVLVLSKCFDNITSDILSSYVAHKNLGNYTIRGGSSFNHKGGSLHKIKMVINNFDHHVSIAKLINPLEYSSQIQNVRLPSSEEDPTLGFLASIIAWTPSGHMRAVNVPVIDPSICERNTRMLPGHYVCLGGVQDPNRHFCRRDNGGAVIQNKTLIAVASFINTCALYSKTHAFPKVASFSSWLSSIIWDEESEPTTTTEPHVESTATTKEQSNATEKPRDAPFYDPSKFMLTLPFDPINVPLEPAEDNSVLPRMSLYESYLQSMSKSRQGAMTEPSSTTVKAKQLSTKIDLKSAPLAMQVYRHMIPKRYDFDYN